MLFSSFDFLGVCSFELGLSGARVMSLICCYVVVAFGNNVVVFSNCSISLFPFLLHGVPPSASPSDSLKGTEALLRTLQE